MRARVDSSTLVSIISVALANIGVVIVAAWNLSTRLGKIDSRLSVIEAIDAKRDKDSRNKRDDHRELWAAIRELQIAVASRRKEDP